MSLRRVVFDPRELPAELIAGQGTFNLLAIELLFQAIATSTSATAKFGIAFAEGSDNRMLRTTGNDPELEAKAASLLLELRAGHYFVILVRGSYPIAFLNAVKDAPTTVRVDIASGNRAVFALFDADEESSAVLGVADGKGALYPEDEGQRLSRKTFVKDYGYVER